MFKITLKNKMKTNKQNKTKRNMWVHLRLIQKTSEHLIVQINSIEYEISVAYYAITAGVILSQTIFLIKKKDEAFLTFLHISQSIFTLRISMIQLYDLW